MLLYEAAGEVVDEEVLGVGRGCVCAWGEAIIGSVLLVGGIISGHERHLDLWKPSQCLFDVCVIVEVLPFDRVLRATRMKARPLCEPLLQRLGERLRQLLRVYDIIAEAVDECASEFVASGDVLGPVQHALNHGIELVADDTQSLEIVEQRAVRLCASIDLLSFNDAEHMINNKLQLISAPKMKVPGLDLMSEVTNIVELERLTCKDAKIMEISRRCALIKTAEPARPEAIASLADGCQYRRNVVSVACMSRVEGPVFAQCAGCVVRADVGRKRGKVTPDVIFVGSANGGGAADMYFTRERISLSSTVMPLGINAVAMAGSMKVLLSLFGLWVAAC